MVFKVKLIRVVYGRDDTPVKDREYKIDGIGPVGTIAEFKKRFSNEKFEVVEKYNCVCG